MKKLFARLGAALVVACLFAPLNAAHATQAFNKVNLLVDDLAKGNVDLNTDTIKAMLSNTAPVATNHCYSDISGNELTSGNGYTTGGVTVTGTSVSNASGVETMAAAASTWTSSTGNMGPLRYVIYYDAAPLGNASAACKPILGDYDNGSSITLNGANGDTFTSTPASGHLFTLQ
ncbi:MAG: hypothetical protein WDN29_16365 [Methylovirgula sp.]